MSSTPNLTQNLQHSTSPTSRPTMPPPNSGLGRLRPGRVQTNIPAASPRGTNPPTSAISASSAASSLQEASPMMSPDAAVLTTNSSAQPSPEPSRGRELDDQVPATPFQLPESVLSRKTSSNSLGQSLMSPSSAMSEAMGKGGIVRRLSNKIPNVLNRRRTSSVAPNSRDGSVGPAMVRKRSGSTNAPPQDRDATAIYTDSDESILDLDDRSSHLEYDGASRELISNGNSGTRSPSEFVGPVYPLPLVTGTWITKVSKKNRSKRILLVLEPDAARISWDKGGKHKIIYIDDIKEVRRGSDTRQYRLDFGILESEGPRWFSLIYYLPEKSKSKMMHLIAGDLRTFTQWVDTLEVIMQHRQDSMSSLMSFHPKAIESYWQKEMSKTFGDMPHCKDHEDLDFQGVDRVCHNLHIHASRSQLLVKFKAADRYDTGRLNFAKFQEFVSYMKRRDDIRAIYLQFALDPEVGLSLEEFLNFLRRTQCEDVSKDLVKWQTAFNRFAKKSISKDPEKQESSHDTSSRMSDAGLAEFFASKYNVPLIEEPEEYCLDYPMNQYFISSSHNTYLLGRQVAGQSSVEGYISALMNGCRCVEVDCWDGPDGQPEVCHGRTLTTSISFREVMTTINKYAFVATQFPLWISLEVHTCPLQQARMAEIMKETFGNRLVTEPLDPASDKLPSPSELKGRILIKVKKTQQKDEGKTIELAGRRRGNSVSSPYTYPVVLDNTVIPSQPLLQSPLLSPHHPPRPMVNKSRVQTISEGRVSTRQTNSGGGSDSEGGLDKLEQEPERKTERVLGDLGVYCAGVKFKGFDTAEAKTFNHIFSFMESSFSKYSKTKEAKKQLEWHNRFHLMRVYPNQTRITSNNFDPLLYWRRGVQMAALNWQTFDLGMQVNKAMFEGGTDASGYVLKPSSLRQFEMRPGVVNKRERKTVSFTIKVISAQQLMRPNGYRAVNPYVEVEVFHSSDKRYKNDMDPQLPTDPDTPLKQRTQVVPENGFNPSFDKTLKFKVTTKYPELIFVRWSVKLSYDGTAYNDRAPVATFTAKLTSLKQGYRTMPLLDQKGEEYLFSTLFCHIQIDPIATVLYDYPVDQPETGNKLRGLGRNVFGRSSNTSPKSSMEKLSMDSSFG